LGIGVAGQIFKAQVRDREAEVVWTHFFKFRRFIENHRRGSGQNARVGRRRLASRLTARSAKNRWWLTMMNVGFKGRAAHLGD